MDGPRFPGQVQGTPFNPIVLRKYRTSNLSRNTVAVVALDSELIVSVPANRKFAVRATLNWTLAAVTPGFKFALGGTCTLANMLIPMRTLDNTAFTNVAFHRATTLTTGISEYVPGANLVFTSYLEGTLEVGTTAGTFGITWSQSVSNGSDTTLLRGSNLLLEEIF